jgi:hypothetical protein
MRIEPNVAVRVIYEHRFIGARSRYGKRVYKYLAAGLCEADLA